MFAIAAPLALALLAGCASSSVAQTPVAEPAPPPPPPPVAQPAAPAPAPVPGPTQQAPVLPLNNAVSYICDDGQKATTDWDRAAGVLRVIRGGETLVLQEQVGYKPPRFVLGASRLDLDGETATIYRGVTRNAERVATCHAIPDAPRNGLIWGTLTKLDRMALVPGTKARVLLVDAARADAPATEIASTSLVTSGNQVPLNFRIAYDVDRVTPRGQTYRLQARIEGPDGKLQYITDTATFVLETAEPQQPVELMLVRAGGQ
ncbi:YbaY family lipoprotein [Sandaracinobacter neustonicus]|uniref:YbaY family lipoprotein n=1 Tax=Sandaracinobacter neustonicus TaxID=1715348 RepID=UPI001F3CD432|nr:YbaY family lipoprotein [Sandaracinobacter neustonicus]